LGGISWGPLEEVAMPRKTKKNYGLRLKINEVFSQKDLVNKHLDIMGEPEKSIHEYIVKQQKICELHNKSNHTKKMVLFKKEYGLTGNPLIAWEALLLCLENDYRLPSWVNSYLKESAINLLSLDHAPRMAGKIASALGVYTGGRGTVFSQLQATRLKFRAVEMVIELKLSNPLKRLEDIFSDVAEKLPKRKGKFISNQTVEKWFDELKDTLG
jgi:hypothetical protein